MDGSINALNDLYADFSALHMEGGWHRVKPALWPQPLKNFEPHHWRYTDVKPLLDRAGELIGTDKAERRNLTMTNPVAGNLYPTIRTIVAAYQMIKPGEVARAHRHTPNALRLILEGRGTHTVVDGQRVEMRPGDVLLTPAWSWHSHDNAGEEDCYWMDFLDVPLVHLLEPMFFEHHPDGVEKDVVELAEAPIAFRWEDTSRQLADATVNERADAHQSIELGAPALKTISLHLQKLHAGKQTHPFQTTANNIFAVMQGEGESIIDGQRFQWGFGDTICAPAWRAYQHNASSDAILLKVSDAPVMEAFGWLKERFA